MNLTEAIEVRRSRRKYLGTPIDPGVVSGLRELLAEYGKAGNVRMELVVNNGEAFKGVRKSYGMFSGVNDYVGLIADPSDAAAIERIGYYGELLVLHATAMGLGTCWVGAGGARADMPFSVSGNEELVCTIVLGNTDEKDSFKEKLIRGIVRHKTKTVREMFESDGPIPDWFMDGMNAVGKAPSTVNRQPVMFYCKAGKASAEAKDGSAGFVKLSPALLWLDFGIAKLHFELGAGGGKWEWGNGGEFARRGS